ncbi:hypothetical protein DKX38_029383 [Salix brachista]|uniref:isopentenyl-diphosphate Delta-isomerase n=1 Tax=Salix brachista TaxID=2182728 RepID=A0A5N5J3W3_9ROSI|nr:hypothetical protein DKX38_029383 [Salix brachista]
MSLTSRILFTPPTIKLSPSLPPSSPFSPLRTPSLPSNSINPSFLRFARVFSSSKPTATPTTTMGDAPDAGMDAVQRRLMFDDESVSHLSSPLSFIYMAPDTSPSFLALILCILVDENDRVVGHDSKYNCHLWENILKGNALHRAFSVFLFNSKHELLLQQRSKTKVTFPLVWTNTCCSHPLYRESELIDEDVLGVRNAAQRKLFDELGIPAKDVPVDQFSPLGRILYKAPSDGKWGEHEQSLQLPVMIAFYSLLICRSHISFNFAVDYLLFIVRDVSVNPNPDEVADIKYVNQDELKELLRKADAGEEGLKLSPWFRLVVDNFLFKWWDHVEKGTLEEAAEMKTIHKLT